MLNQEQINIIRVAVISPIIAFFTPANGFIAALVIAYGFNIFCGMRADGISIKVPRIFSMKKFRKSLAELLIYICIDYMLFAVIVMAGDSDSALYVVKSLNYVFIYVYVLNSFKNLVMAYPDNKSFKITYHILRFEFKRLLPEFSHGAVENILKDKKENENEE